MWQISIATSAEAEDAVACLLESIVPGPPCVYCDEATGRTTITSYPSRLPGSSAAFRERLRAELRRLRGQGLKVGSGRVIIATLPRKNWAESWKHHFKPIDIDGALLIKPGWSKRKPRRDQHELILDPGMSFGTGHHATTLFCLQRLVRCRIHGQKQSFLDIGTGTGILAIAAAKLGYAPVDAFDNDPVAVKVSRANARRNGVARRLKPVRKDLTRLSEKPARQYDIICANLARDLLISEAPKIRARLNPGGVLIIAGMLRKQFIEVAKILHGLHLTLRFKKSDNVWTSGQFVLPWP
jgi:ribosomal protein L11 methyltransferase